MAPTVFIIRVERKGTSGIVRLAASRICGAAGSVSDGKNGQTVDPEPRGRASSGRGRSCRSGQNTRPQDYRCVICHRIDSEGNAFGPELTHVGSCRKPDFLFAIVANPGRLDPDTAMRNFNLTPDEIVAVVQYLRTLE